MNHLFIKKLEKNIFDEKYSSNSKIVRFSINVIKIIIITSKKLRDNRFNVEASALTLYTLMSVVPVIAIFFGIAKGFGMDNLLQKEIEKHLNGQEVLIQYITGFAHNMLQNTNGGLIAGVGLLILLWSVIQLLSKIEISFNNIWNVKKSRSIIRKFTDYISIILIAPVFIIISGSINVLVANFSNISIINNYFAPIVVNLLWLIPFLLTALLFSFIYIVIPNTSVKPHAAIIGGLFTGIIFQITQSGYVFVQYKLSSYNAIYGSFAILPLFIIWLNIAWYIVIGGAHLVNTIETYKNYSLYQNNNKQLNIYSNILYSIIIVKELIKTIVNNNEPLNVHDISKKTKLPLYICNDILSNLVEKKILYIVDKDKYIIANDVNQLSIVYLINKIIEFDKVDDNVSYEEVKNVLINLNNILKNSDYNKLIKDI